MSRKDHALSLFSQHFNCSQAVFAAYRLPDALDESAALKLASVFGAGVASTGRGLCGAVTGGLMALSMKHGRGDLDSVEAKAKTYELGRKFMETFEARHGSCVCERLLGICIGTPEGHRQAQEARLFETQCLGYVSSAAEILDDLL